MTSFTARVQANEGGFVENREVPITHTLVTSTSMGGANVAYTVREGVNIKVQRLSVANTSASPANLSMHGVPDGGAAALGNTELGAITIPANTSVDLTDMVGGFYTEKMQLRFFASVASVLVVHGWAEEIL